MKTLRSLLPCLVMLAAVGGCASLNPWNGDPKTIAAQKAAKLNTDPANTPVEQLYNNGVDALNSHRYALAVEQFDATSSNITRIRLGRPMRSSCTAIQNTCRNHYSEAISTLDRFIQLHPVHRDVAYAYYLRALSYYEQIADIQRDQKGTQEAMTALQEVVNRFPDSAYAADSRLKIDLCRDHLAGKEMEIGRFYESQHLYTAAINRYQRVIDDYQTTNHTPEALYRLTEVYLILGLTDQAKKTAAVLGHNYPGSRWYADSYNNLVDEGDIPNAHGRIEKPGFLARNFGSIF